MQTVNNIRRRATGELRRRIFRSGVFRRQHMKNLAGVLAREHTSELSAEDLLILARHDTWLKSSRVGRSPYPGEKIERIEDELHSYIKSELRVIVDTFWDGRTSVDLVVQRSSVELAGFFNGDRPGHQAPAEGRYDDAHSQHSAPYV